MNNNILQLGLFLIISIINALLFVLNINNISFLQKIYSNSIFFIHFLCIIITYSVLIMSCIHIAIIFILEKSLHNPQHYKNKYISKFLLKCPPLLRMQEILKRRLYALATFMLFVIISGIYLWSKEDLSHITHKVIFSVSSWLVFVYFLYKKHSKGIDSNKTIYYILAIFMFWLLSYLGSYIMISLD